MKQPPLRLGEEGPFFIVTLPRQNPALVQEGLGERQRELLGLPDTFFPFSTLDYAKRFSVSERMARLDIRSLVEKGFLLTKRKGRVVRYVRK